jgi:hypothetical protein
MLIKSSAAVVSPRWAPSDYAVSMKVCTTCGLAICFYSPEGGNPVPP